MRLRVGTDVAAPPEAVYAVYADYRRWPAMFPTIHAVQRVGDEDGAIVLAIDHREGPVRNVMRLVPPDRIVLDENKRGYDATFVNTFRPAGGGTRFEVEGDIRLKGFRRYLAPLVRPYARRLMRRFTLAPVKAEAERGGPA